MGTLYIVATPIGNLSDMSPRAIETLKEVDFIAVEDTRRTIKLLNAFDIKKKMISYHKFNEKSRSSEIIGKLINDDIDVALVSDAGTPCISDPGYILVKEAREHNIPVIGISGPSAVITALSISGFDTTSFSFYGFLPQENKEKNKLIDSIKASDVNTFVLYESPKRIIKLAELINQEFPDAMVCFCSDLTKLFEKSFYGNPSDVLERLKANSNVEKGEYTVVVKKGFKADELKEEDSYSIEAKIVECIIENKCTMKDAISYVKDKYPDISKTEIYNATLRLKALFETK